MKEDTKTSIEEKLPKIPLVRLNVENITYAPITKQYASQSRNRLSFRKKSDGYESNLHLARKTIVNDVTPPTIEPYQLQAWMGPSGSGKTTLLSIATGLIDVSADPDAFGEQSRITMNDDSTNLLGGKGMKSNGFPRGLIGVVWQDDMLLSNLTVRETIAFAAKLKTPASAFEQIDIMIDDILNELGLTEIQHSLVGQSGGVQRGISGGERKRVSVAQELVTRPSLLFLDEPTSGLDATSAFELVKTLRGLAERNGQGFVMVVHQPRTIIFELMDNLLLLSKGEEVYSGHPSGARKVLESCPIIGRPLPDQTNVADFIIDMIKVDENRLLVSHTGGVGSAQNDSRLLPRHWVNCKNDLENAVSSDNLQKKRVSRSMHKLSSIVEIKNSVPKYTAPFLVQLTLLAKRAVKQSRGERISRASLVTTVIFIVFECAFWFQMKNDTNHSYNRYSLLFFMIIAQANGVVVASIPTFKRDTALLSRERAKKMYQVFPYFLGRSFADLTATIFLPCVHSIPVYWVTNLRPRADAFILFSCMYYLTITTAQSLGLLLSTVFPSLQMALVVTPAISIFMMIVAGYYIPLSNMSAWMAWSKYISFCTYGYSSLLVIEFDGRDIPCASDVVLSIGDSTECPLPGKEILNSLGITGLLSNIWFNAIILIFMQVAFRCGAYLMVRRSR